jgi:hypothetical protein
VHNFYSSTENVLAEYDGEVPESVFQMMHEVGLAFSANTWVYQEKAKGQRVDYLNKITHVGSLYMGWGFNWSDSVNPSDPVYYVEINDPRYPYFKMYKPAQAIGIPSDEVLRRHPVFDSGESNSSPEWIKELFGANGSVIAADEVKNMQLLAEAIPAMSWAVGSHEVGVFGGRNHDMAIEYADQQYWPNGKNSNGVIKWWHNDMREVAYSYQIKLFKEIKSIVEE